MSGSGGNRDDYSSHRPPRPTPTNADGGVGGDGGAGGDDPCAIVQDAPINSPNPMVVPGLAIGDVLNVVVAGTPQRTVLEVRTSTGLTAGSLTQRGHLEIVRCIGEGNIYQAEVIQKSGGAVIVRIERA